VSYSSTSDMLLWPVVLNDSNGEASEVNQGAVSTSTIAEQMQVLSGVFHD